MGARAGPVRAPPEHPETYRVDKRRERHPRRLEVAIQIPAGTPAADVIAVRSAGHGAFPLCEGVDMAGSALRNQPVPTEPTRLKQLQVPGRLGSIFASAREADKHLLAQAPAGFLDTTHFDTVRF